MKNAGGWGGGGGVSVTVQGSGSAVRFFLDSLQVPSVCCYQPLVVRGTSLWWG